MFHPFDKSGDITADAPLLVSALAALADRDRTATLANAASLLNWYLEDINWVGFYLWNEEDGELILGPFHGLPACIRISRGRGVCGTAAETGDVQLVKDVHSFPGHIACDADSRSELVIPLSLSDGTFFGVLDLDSSKVGRFSDSDAEGIQLFCQALLESSAFRET